VGVCCGWGFLPGFHGRTRKNWVGPYRLKKLTTDQVLRRRAKGFFSNKRKGGKNTCIYHFSQNRLKKNPEVMGNGHRDIEGVNQNGPATKIPSSPRRDFPYSRGGRRGCETGPMTRVVFFNCRGPGHGGKGSKSKF